MADSRQFEWDAFISHASEDKAVFVEPLAAELKKYGLKIWFDKFTLRIGSSLRESIDEGLARSHFGIVVLSPAFFAKNWPQKELNALFSRQVNGSNIILPIWHSLSKQDLLNFSPLLSDIVAVNSSDGPVPVARSLVQVIRPEALQFDATREDAQNAATRMREHVKTINPVLESRIIFGPQDLNSQKLMGTPVGLDVLFTSAQEGMRIEVFAPDPDAYKKNPLSFTLRMPIQAWEKLQIAHNEGRPVELGPEESIEVASDFVELLNPAQDRGFIALQKLVIAPSADAMQRKFQFKVTFTSQDEREEFPYVEFEMIRPGEQEIEIQSCSPALALRISIALNLVSGVTGVTVSYSPSGHEIRQLYKVFRAIRLLRSGGIEIFNLQSNQPLGRLMTAHPTSSWEDSELSSVIDAAHEIVTALNDTLTWPQEVTRADLINLQLLRELVNTGRLELRIEKITLNMVPSDGVDLNETLRGPNLLRLELDNPPEFATVFGKTLNLGRYRLIVGSRDFETAVDEHNPSSRVVSITPAEAVLFEVERFCKA